MGQKLKPLEPELYKRIDKILYLDWNPIGVSGQVPEDEYQSYLPIVFKLTIDNINPMPLMEYLKEVRTKTIGLSSNDAYDLEIAEKILQTKQDIGL